MKNLFLFIIFLVSINLAYAADKTEEKKDPMSSPTFSGLKFRSIGPGLTSGRIIDFAVNPQLHSNFYVAAAAGGVWKTVNGGYSFTPVFESQGSYSIGCITLDPSNPHTLWVGTGENNSQRSVGYGDGVYKSMDDGKTWKNVGLKKSEHIGRILVDPRNSNVVYVSAEGPLWGPGGDRGLYKTTDGGDTWEKILNISENTGVYDIVFDPRNPDVIFATAYQRRRHVWTLIDGGPEGGLYKSTDAGKTFRKITNGIPGGDIGRIGIIIPPTQPDIVYAIIEADGDAGGFFKSTDRGESWERRSGYTTVSAQYYERLIADPKDADKIYVMDTYLSVTEDGGKTFHHLGNKYRHVDDHVLWIEPENTDHMLVGGDGGMYETYDGGQTWRHVDNLSISQFYRVCVDNSQPFYYVYGGTQDNSSWGGPSQTTNSGGITNEEWFLIVGGDGYKAQVDPDNPNIVYGQWQYGNLVRFDRKSGEQILIQPQAEKGEELRWNWDTPLLLSKHSNTRLYIGANRLFRTDDRGNTWKAISPDLTRRIDRDQLKVMDKLWNPEAIAKNASTSLYGNITSIAESPINQNLLYVGTDDGLIQVTNDGGTNWTKIDKFPKVPEFTYVNDIVASQFDENIVYATFYNYKSNDFKPYVLMSKDKGKSWTSITGGLPDSIPVYCISEDFVKPDLLFLGTEYGCYFTVDQGKKWIQLKSGLPTIAVRDMEIQQRECDLVLGTFGRGIYILDNYQPLRDVNSELFNKDAYIFPIKDALMYVQDQSKEKNDLGETFYRGSNPDFGATFTYYWKESLKTKKDLRKEQESADEKAKKQIKYPTADELRAEDNEEKPYLIFKITDENDKVVRLLTTTPAEGINRLTWDLRYPGVSPLGENSDPNKEVGYHVLPGKYKVAIFKNINGEISKVTDFAEFTAKPLNNATLPAANRQDLVDFQKKVGRAFDAAMGAASVLDEMLKTVRTIKKTLLASTIQDKDLIEKARNIEVDLMELNIQLSGDPSIAKRNANQTPSILDRCSYLVDGLWGTTSEPTQTQKLSYKIIGDQLVPVLDQLRKIKDTDIHQLDIELNKLYAPWTPGRVPDWKAE